MERTLRALLICPDSEEARCLRTLLLEDKHLRINELSVLPSRGELAEILRADVADVVFLSVDSPELAEPAICHIRGKMPGVQIVGIARSCSPDLLMAVMRLGLREFLAMPFQRTCVNDCLRRVRGRLGDGLAESPCTGLIYSFLPAKPGVGASTLAVSTALALAALPDNRTLLMDFDLTCGMVRFLLRPGADQSVVDAAQRAPGMTDELWTQLISRTDGLEVLHGGGINAEVHLNASQIHDLLAFARRRYRTICVDLSGHLEQHSLEVMRESERICVVVTPEVPAVHLAKEKLRYLDSLGLGGRTAILLNRHSKSIGLSTSEVEVLLGKEMFCTFPNDYRQVSAAIESARGVDPASDLGRQIFSMACDMARMQSPGEPQRRFNEYLGFTPPQFSPPVARR